MNLYRLSETFTRSDVIDDFASLIWTDRYGKAGDCQITAPATPAMMNLLAPGNFLGLEGSTEVMLLDTISQEKNVLTASGRSLLYFLNSRIYRSSDMSASSKNKTSNLSNRLPHTLMALLVQYACIDTAIPQGFFGNNSQQIQYLSTYTDPAISGMALTSYVVPFGSVYDAVNGIAETAGLGHTLELVSASLAGYALRYRVYQGKDRTSRQTANPLVRFVASLDSLMNTKELQSIMEAANIVYTVASSISSSDLGGAAVPYGFAYLPGALEASDFKRRTKMVYCDDIDPAAYSSATELKKALDWIALNEIIKSYIIGFDGELVPNNIYKLGVDFFLGDIVEMMSGSGVAMRARVSEVIHTQDKSGTRVYPTLEAVV